MINGLVVAVDASRNRSGGAVAHLIGLLSHSDLSAHNIKEVHVWSYPELLSRLPNYSWLHKHTHKFIEKNLLMQLLWQRFIFPQEFLRAGCNIVLNTDAGSICNIAPSVTMSRDMLSYEAGEMRRYSFSLAGLRLLLLRYAQNASLRRSNGVIFLTKYASKVIQQYCGELSNIAHIPHGISDLFRSNPRSDLKAPLAFEILYLSNIDLYKHQWSAVAAVEHVRGKGFDVRLKLVGGGSGKALRKLEDQIALSDPTGDFVQVIPFVPHESVPSLHASADLFLFASSCENMPNTLVEAMAAGLPIVCSRRGPMPEVLEDGGVYFDPEDVSSIASAIENLVTDAELRKQVAERAHELSFSYSWSKCADSTWAFISKTYARSLSE